jgi:sulfate-transporting ATPase
VRTFQNLELFADLTVRENLLVAADPENTYQYATGLVYAGKRHLRGAAQAASDLFGLGPFLDDGVERLANGTQHLVATARAVASDPLVVCLDEPTAGSNGRERAAACEVIRAMAAELGMAVLIIEHNLDVISSVCDDVIVLDFGKTIATGTPEEVLAVDAVRSAYLGIEAEAEQLDVADTAPPSSPVAST